jgi:cyclohexanecarboxylate-CoA ligase
MAAHGPGFVDSYLSGRADREPESIAYVDARGPVTCARLADDVRRASAALTGLGVRQGDVVSWQLPNWREAAVIHFATSAIGAVSNPIVPIYRRHEVGYILRASATKVFVVPDSFRGFDYAAMATSLIADAPAFEHIVAVGGKTSGSLLAFEELLTGGDASPAPSRSVDDVVLLLYTSGTTSHPKGVQHTHRTLDYENLEIIQTYELGRGDIVFMPSPVTHVTGLLYGLQLPHILGSMAVLQDVWEPKTAMKLIQDHSCSFAVAATPFLHGIVTHPERGRFDLASLKVFACGGAEVPPELVRRSASELGCCVARVYGSTEYPTAAGSGPSDPVGKRAETDGRSLGETEIVIVDDDGAPLPAMAQGEILLRGPEMFVGYRAASLNEIAFTADGFFHTGDVGLLDHDGYLTVTGRKKDIIIRGGENISAKELEDLLYEDDRVAEAAIVGMPDPVLGERVCAMIVLHGGREMDSSEVTSRLRDRGVATQKLPERVDFVTELPRTASGKIQKYVLRDRLRGDVEAARRGRGT